MRKGSRLGETPPWLRLAAATLLQATRDAEGRDPVVAADACVWLRDTGADLAEALNLDRANVPKWVGDLPALDIVEGLLALVRELEEEKETMSENMDAMIRQAAGRQPAGSGPSSEAVIQSVADGLGLTREEVGKRLQELRAELQPPPQAGAGAGTGSGGKPPAGDPGVEMERSIRRAVGAPDPTDRR